MYGAVRSIIGILLFGSAFFVIRKRKVLDKRKQYVFSAVMVVMIVTVLAFVPFENAFVSFASPESAYNYVSFGKTEVKQVVQGNKSALVVSKKNDGDEHLIIPKARNGWKIGLGINTRRIASRVLEDVSVYAYQYKDTGDYYVVVCNIGDGISEIQDCRGTVFHASEESVDSLDAIFVTYYAYIPDLDWQYWISVNGERIMLID